MTFAGNPMHPSPPNTYPYKPKATTIILCILFFGACAAVFGWKAAANDRGLILNGILTFSTNGASIFYWTLAILSLGFVFIGIAFIIQRATGSLNLEITDSAVRIPRGFIKKSITEVQFADVIDLSETEIQGQRFFYLHTPGKRFCVNRALMPSKDNYEEAKMLIITAIAANNQQDGIERQAT